MFTTGQAGTHTAFDAIVETHHAEIYRYLRSVVSRGTEAEHLVQETFLRAFRGHRSLPADADVRVWLFGIASTLCRTAVRSGRRHGPRPEGGVTRHEARSRLEGVILGLPITQRLAFTMRKLHDFGYDTIGASLDCAAETARAHVLQALRQIRRRLDGLTRPRRSGDPASAATGRALMGDRASRGRGRGRRRLRSQNAIACGGKPARCLRGALHDFDAGFRRGPLSPAARAGARHRDELRRRGRR